MGIELPKRGAQRVLFANQDFAPRPGGMVPPILGVVAPLAIGVDKSRAAGTGTG